MTLTSTTNRVQYNGDGATVAFAVTFNFWDADDLRVILTETSSGTETVWTRGTQYTVSGGSGTTGTVTVSTSPTDYTPASGYTLTIKSNITDTQDTSLPAGGSIPSASLEQQMDKIVRMVQQKDEELARSLKFAESSSQTDQTVPEPSDGKILGWNGSTLSNLTPNSDTYLSVTAFALTLLDDADAATARATLGAGTLSNLVEDTTPQLGGALDANSNIVKWSKGADVASANALTLGTDGNYFDITGTTAITSIGTLGIGTVVKLHFDGALTLTHNATDLILPGGANITTAAGDEAEFVEYASGDWRCTAYTKADGTAVSGGGLVFIASATASTSSSLDFPTQLTSTYDAYLITISALKVTADQAGIYFRITDDSGSTYESAAYRYDGSHSNDTDAGTGSPLESTSASQIAMTTNATGTAPGNAADESVSGEIRIYAPSNTATHKFMQWDLSFLQSTGLVSTSYGSGSIDANTNAWTGFQILPGSSTFASGVVRLYGIVNS